MRRVPDRVLLLGSVAATVVPGALAWSHWSAGALLWTPAILAGIGVVAVMPADRGRADVTRLVAGGCAAISSITTVAILVVAGPLDVRSMSAGAATLAEALGLVALTVVAVRVRAPGGRLVVAALGTLAMATLNYRFEGPATTYERLMGTLLWALAGLAAAAGGRHLREQDERRARALADAKRAQRLLLARDLHDFVAHDLSAALAQAQAGQLLGVDDERVAGTFRSIEDSAQRALRSMDRTLRMLRELEADLPGVERSTVAPPDLSELRALVERFDASGTWRVRLDVDPELEACDPAWLPAEVSTTLYRVAVEALTNVRLHARGAGTVRVRLVRHVLHGGTECVELTVVDDAAGAPAPGGASKRGGSGLPTLADRVEALGGRLHAGPEATCGWAVRAVVPLDAHGTGP